MVEQTGTSTNRILCSYKNEQVTETEQSKVRMKSQKTLNRQSNLEKEK